MYTFSGQLAIVQDKNEICLADTGSTLGYQKGGNIPVQLMQGSAKSCICGKVECTGTVIQNQKFRFLDNGTCNGKTLLLTAGKIAAVLLQSEIKLAFFPLDDLTCLGSILIRFAIEESCRKLAIS